MSRLFVKAPDLYYLKVEYDKESRVPLGPRCIDGKPGSRWKNSQRTV